MGREGEGGQPGRSEETTAQVGDEAAFLSAREERVEMAEPGLDGGVQEQELEGTTEVQHSKEHVAGAGPSTDDQAGEPGRSKIDLTGDHDHGRQVGSVRGRVASADHRDQETRAKAHQRDQVDTIRRFTVGRSWR